MRKKIKVLFLLLISTVIISACNSSTSNEESTSEEEESKDNTKLSEQENNDEHEKTSEDNFELPKNQLGLNIGDTAHHKVGIAENYREYEITLNSVEIMDSAGNEPSQEGNYVLVNLTLKNISEVPVTAADAFSGTGLENENTSDFPWFYIDGVAEEWPSEIQPGESQTGVLLYDIAIGNSYVLSMSKTNIGNSNTITFEFTADEAE